MTTGKAFQRRVTWTVAAVAWPAVGLVVLYILALVRLPPAHWEAFARALLAGVAVLGPGLTLLYARLYAPLVRILDRLERGEATPAELREGWRRICVLPLDLVLSGLASWVGGSAIVVLATAWQVDDMPLFSAVSLLMGLVSGGVVCEVFIFFLCKRVVERERLRLAAALAPDERAALVRPVPLARKLRVSVTAVTLLTVVFAALLALSGASRSTEEFASRAQQALLGRLGPEPDAAALDALEAEARALGIAEHVLVVDPRARAVRHGDPRGLAAVELDVIARAEAASGDATGFHSPNALAWRRLADGRVVVAAASWQAVSGESGHLRAVLLGVLAISAGLAWCLAWAVSMDVGGATAALERRLAAVAGGDLRGSDVFDGEDELGALGRGVDRMAAALRRMVSGVAETAARVDGASDQLGSAADGVAAATAGQVGAIRAAHESTGQIGVGVDGIADSAQALRSSLEESAGAVHELAAVGRELNATANELSAKVDSVSSAVEEMAASVREVARSADALTSAAGDTSTSMEEMASSMREVETNAGETSRLSGRVVAAAERGRERVAQTVAGMQAIQRETETARQVIGALGARAREIGGILTVIDDVADETNLLALNAAIIAAQAGDSGRAFAVVAGQIKALADRVLSSTREIAQRIRAVQDETANAVAAIERGSQRVADGVTLSAEAGGSLEEITAAARESGDRVEEIVGAMREQSKAAAHVVGLMEQVQSGIERIRRASAEQDRGNELILREIVDMRGASQRVRQTSEEQQTGAARIRDAVEAVREAVERITGALQEQSFACARATELLDSMRAGAGENEASVARMNGAIRELAGDAEALRASVSRFAL